MFIRKRLLAVLLCLAVFVLPTTSLALVSETDSKDKVPDISVSAYPTSAYPTINYTFTSGTRGTYYSDFVTVSGGTSPYTWTISSGSLPSGLRGSYYGNRYTVSGTPTSYGTYYFTLRVRDANGYTATKSLSIYIASSYSYYSKLPTLHNDHLGGVSDRFTAELRVAEQDILSAGEGRDNDLVTVRAGQPVHFILGEWLTSDGESADVRDVTVFVNDEAAEDVSVADDGTFTLPAEMIHDDFKVHVKAQAETGELESEELYISSEEQ